MKKKNWIKPEKLKSRNFEKDWKMKRRRNDIQETVIHENGWNDSLKGGPQ